MAKLTAENARGMLSNTQPHQAFWVNNGPVIKNVIELAAAARKLTAQQFTHHVNKGKNDFAKWVGEVIRDQVLAQKLGRVKTKEGLAAAVTSRLQQLQKLIK